jgi:hypothetical protein
MVDVRQKAFANTFKRKGQTTNMLIITAVIVFILFFNTIVGALGLWSCSGTAPTTWDQSIVYLAIGKCSESQGPSIIAFINITLVGAIVAGFVASKLGS